MKTISEIRKSFVDRYNQYSKDLNELNILVHQLAKETDEILSFMETTIKLKEELEVPKPE